MNIITEYNIGDFVYFMDKQNRDVIGDIKIYGGIIESITCYIKNQKTEINYIISVTNPLRGRYELNERFLFKNIKDINKFFTNNMRQFLDESFVSKETFDDDTDGGEEDMEDIPLPF